LLELQNINKAYGEVVALKDASFSIDRGEIVALLGANGSGKSTMVKILGGSVKADSGTIFLHGQEVKISSSGVSRGLKFAVAYQDLSLISRMTVWENVMLGHFIRGSFGRVDAQKNRGFVQCLIEQFHIGCGLDDYPQDLPPSTLSLIEIIKAISWQPDVLLLDEVTATLHHNEVGTLFENLRMLAQSGMSIVTVTHRLEEVFHIASRAVILRNGVSVADIELNDTDIPTIVYHMTGKKPEAVDHSPTAEETSGDERDVVLDVENVSVGETVKCVSMKIRKGEIVGLGGLEGQGQSDFLRAIYGVHPIRSGAIRLDGRPLKPNSPADAVKHGIGFISGDRNRESVFPQRSIGENIYSAKLSKGNSLGYVTDKKINRESMDVVKNHDIKIGKITDPVSSLSGGNQQKVVFGRWICESPEVLLLDDPTKGVDVAARVDLHDFLRSATQNGMTVVMVSSDNVELLDVSDRIYIFYEGNIHAVLAGEDRTEEKLVSAMMGMSGKEAQA
jgi:ribose transport system ATP-binding protein